MPALLSPTSHPVPTLRYAVSAAVTACALVLSLLAQPLILPNPFLLFYGSVALSAWYGGLSGGLISTVLSVVLADYFLIAPYGTLSVDALTLIRLAMFALIGCFITALSESSRRDKIAAAQARERAAFLSHSSALLARSLDYHTTLQQVADLAVPALCDWCVVDVLDEGGEIVMMAAAHRDPTKVRWARALREQYPVSRDAPVGAPKVIRTGEADLYADIPDSLLEAVARSPEELHILREVGYRSLLIAPLGVGGRVIGAISFVSAESGRHYSPEDVPFALEVAQRAAAAIDNARLYRQAQEERANAERAVRARDDFLSVAAHELKTPLTSLKLQVQLMERRAQREGGLSERDGRVLQVLNSQIRRFDRLIGTLLDVSRLEHGQLSVRHEPFDLDGLIRRVIAEIQPISDTHPIAYTPVGPPPAIEGDELRLEQVLQNLLHNAIKYSPGGGPVAVTLEGREGVATIAVSDRGIGIAQGELPNLFTQFYRGANASVEHISGLGIGLFVVREIVRLHGGAVRAESVEGEGSTFIVELPLAPQAAGRPAPAERPTSEV